MSYKISSKYVNDDIDLVFGRYGNGSLVIQGVNSNDGMPEFVATVALDYAPAPGHVFIKTWSENEGLAEALVAAGVIGEPVAIHPVNNFGSVAFECPLLVQP